MEVIDGELSLEQSLLNKLRRQIEAVNETTQQMIESGLRVNYDGSKQYVRAEVKKVVNL